MPLLLILFYLIGILHYILLSIIFLLMLYNAKWATIYFNFGRGYRLGGIFFIVYCQALY